MNIGDRVRLMHGREEGIITRFLENNLVEVAIDNDFTIPVLRREIVVIAPEEDKAFGKNQQQFVAPEKVKRSEPIELPAAGIFVALTHQSSELLAVNVVNNTDFDVLFTYGEERNGQYRGIANDKVASKAAKTVAHLHLKEFEKWPHLVLQYLQHRQNSNTLLEPGHRKLQFKASTFYKSKKPAPVLKQEAYLFQIDQKPVALNPEKLKETLSALEQTTTAAYKLETPAHEVDLHIEKLTQEDPKKMSNAEILRTQLAVFQDNLDRAIAANMHEIIFIHGVGNGVLRKELHKLLSRNPSISYFEDAKKEKFGYGATLVKLK
ncbi:MAG: DUF2027 domain-containing protein [Hymenobacteraceae bacterium]|nr:DUF2027 domain-containing protein [Hymenobacteraceae bacterium]MDX5398018.1 DUF2027 domain-containing protein [Hymenobacteraceae bacterium]MDX5443452.1 DUF2027 domain-containing protein [Hymenobacteraceae bacterium]MDX5514089.1 DUF2027 domain-containing protein [Hymenobacteraceae bacterium]